MRRHVPISFIVGRHRQSRVPEEEEPFLEEGAKDDDGDPVRVEIESWEIPEPDQKNAKS